jgi:hypothetical protein
MKRLSAAARGRGVRNRKALIAASPDAYAGLERIKHLEEQFARASVESREHRLLAAAIRIEAVAYRKSLDADQAAATRGRESRLDAGSVSPTRKPAPGKPAPVRHGKTGRRGRGVDA